MSNFLYYALDTIWSKDVPSRRKTPDWLPRILRYIDDSTALLADDETLSRETLSADVASAGRRFFELFAELLPTEPHIYSSSAGDLVAEFEAPGVRMTAVISPDVLVLFAEGRDGTIYDCVPAWLSNTEAAGNTVKTVVGSMQDVPDGAVDA